MEAIRAEIARQFGENPLQNPDYGKIINEKHFHRLLGLMDEEKIVCGGQYDEKTLRIAPTVMTDVTWEDAVMGEEIFGPILPVLTYNALENMLEYFEKVDEPVLIAFFGDHQPHLPDYFYKNIMGELPDELSQKDAMKRYQVPFMIWAKIGRASCRERV